MSHSDTSENLWKNVRKYIFEPFEEHATAPVLELIMRKFGLDRTSAFKVAGAWDTAFTRTNHKQ